MIKPTEIKLRQGKSFGIAVKLSAAEGVDYTGWHVRCDIKYGANVVHDFGEVAIEPQDDGTGVAILTSETSAWDTKKRFQSDVVIIDADGQIIERSNMFTIYITHGITDLVTEP